MNALFWGLTISVIGKILLAIGVFKFHSALTKGQEADRKISGVFKIEKLTTLIGLVLIIVGYVLEIYFYNISHLLTCDGADCASMIELLLSP